MIPVLHPIAAEVRQVRPVRQRPEGLVHGSLAAEVWIATGEDPAAVVDALRIASEASLPGVGTGYLLEQLAAAIEDQER